MPYTVKNTAINDGLLVFKDDNAILQAVRSLSPKAEKSIMAALGSIQTTVYLNLKGSDSNQIAMTNAVKHANLGTVNVTSAAQNRKDVLNWMSAFLFMGILIGIIFVLATALILYYKQVAEGLADAKRYKILQQVGLSEREVRATINSQLLTLFYVPLIVAAVHTAVVTPFIQRLLTLFGIYNWGQFVGIVAATLAVFAVVYVIMYKATAQVYYKIVK